MTEKDDSPDAPNQPDTKPGRGIKRRSLIKIAALTVGLLVVVLAALLGYSYAASPEVIRHPQLQHYHFRMQIVVNGHAENFAQSKYQQAYAKDQCTDALPAQPIHFHDNKDQIVHIHWDGMTGGLVMKYYGWNYIGGIDGALGYRFDDLGHIQRVPIHGAILPAVTPDVRFYIYTGDQNNFQEKRFDDWKSQGLEQFFGQHSNFPGGNGQAGRAVWPRFLFAQASAHAGHIHASDKDADAKTGTETPEERLTRINNLLGNVVIFVQKDKPSATQVHDRFSNLEPLSDSTCGG